MENALKAIRYYYGEDANMDVHIPFSLNLFVDENIWLIFTEYEPDRLGGGIGFTIDAETGELSDYDLNE